MTVCRTVQTRASARISAAYEWLNPFYLIIAVTAVLCIVVAMPTAWMLWDQHAATIAAEHVNLQNLSQAVADQTDRIFASLERAEDRLLDHMIMGDDPAEDRGRNGGTKQLHVLMRDIITGMAEAYALVVANENGDVVSFSNSFPAPSANLRDRAYFRKALAHPELKSFISETIVSRLTTKPTFFVVRRLNGPNSAFAGVLLGAVRVEFLEQVFSANKLPEGGSVSLLRSDGSMLARYPAVAVDAEQVAAAGPVRAPCNARRAECLTSTSLLPGHPLKVVVSVPLKAVMVTWRAEAQWICSLVVLGCVAAMAIGFLATRRFHDRQHLAAAASAFALRDERRRAELANASHYARFGVALDNMSQGLMMFDRAKTLLLSNAAVRKIFGLPCGVLKPGMRFEQVIQAVADAGGMSRDVPAVIEHYEMLFRQNSPVNFLLKPSGRRHLTASFVPFDDGWLVTFEDISEAREADERIMHMATHDALTGLPNRVMLKTSTDEAVSDTVRGGDGFVMMCLDLDDFKDINDTLGHPAGDRLLCEVAKRIESVTRQSDLVVRLGGDEFAILVRPYQDRASISVLATRLIEIVSAPYDIDGQMVFVGVSVGIAVAPTDGTAPDTLMKNADLALYRAKNDGRGRYAFFEASMEKHLLDRHRIENELRNALAAGEFELYYQAIVGVADRRITGFEALIRWHHPTRGLVSPGDFISVSEENGFIVQIGEWVLHKACRDAAQWPGCLKVAVNLSGVQFRSGRLIDTITGALNASGLAPSRLELEITESITMQDTEATLAIIRQVKALGVRLSMDDFGTGYSSLAYLQRFPFDKVKIDRAFVQGSGHATSRAIMRAVTSIAESLGIETTAEGVETEEQFRRVAEAGCHEVQGFLFSQPSPASGVIIPLARQKPPASDIVDRVAEDASLQDAD